MNMVTAIDFLALIMSVIAIVIAIQSHQHSKTNSKAELFSSLRTSYLAIHMNLPKSEECNYQEYKSVFWSYWLNAYNEWYITNYICPKYALWEEFYSDAIQGSLAKENLRRALAEMISESYAFGSADLKEKFLHDIKYTTT